MSLPEPTPATSRPGTLRAWSVVAILLVLAVLASIDRNVISLMVDPIRDGLGLDDFQMGLLQGPAFAIFFLIGSLPMGWVVDRYSSRWAICLGVIGWSLATIACALAGSFVELLVARCLVGLGEAVLQPAAWSMVARLFPAQRLSLAIGVLSSGAQIGAALSFLLGGLLIAAAEQMSWAHLPLIGDLAPWQLVFLAAGLPGVALAWLIFLAPDDAPVRTRARTPAQVGLGRFVADHKAFIGHHFLGFSLHSAAVFGAAAWVPTYLMRNHGLAIHEVGVIMAAAAVPVGACGVLFAGWLVDRAFAGGRNDAHMAHFAKVTALIALVGGLAFALGESVWLVVPVFALIQFFQPFSGVSGALLQIATPEAYRGRVSAAYILFYNAVGMTLGPSFVALLSNYVLGPGQLGQALALSYALFGSLAALLLWRGRRHAQAAVARQMTLTGALQ